MPFKNLTLLHQYCCLWHSNLQTQRIVLPQFTRGVDHSLSWNAVNYLLNVTTGWKLLFQFYKHYASILLLYLHDYKCAKNVFCSVTKLFYSLLSDVNECNLNECSSTQTCINTYGSFICLDHANQDDMNQESSAPSRNGTSLF